MKECFIHFIVFVFFFFRWAFLAQFLFKQAVRPTVRRRSVNTERKLSQMSSNRGKDKRMSTAQQIPHQPIGRSKENCAILFASLCLHSICFSFRFAHYFSWTATGERTHRKPKTIDSTLRRQNEIYESLHLALFEI